MKRWMIAVALLIATPALTAGQTPVVVFQSDFGLKDGAVAAMKGVAVGVSPQLRLFDLTHDIPAYNVWEASYRLEQTVPYWPAGTVFVSVVDPGVGTARRSVVARTRTGHFVVTPDNGTLTHIAASLGVSEVRLIDEQINRRAQSGASYTFHGRDVYAFTAARLAGGAITFEQVGPLTDSPFYRIPFTPAARKGRVMHGSIPVLDVQYGNVWTDIPAALLKEIGVEPGSWARVRIRFQERIVFEGTIPYRETFGAVQPGKPLLYLNSLMQVSFALNQDDFARRYRIRSGPGWQVEVAKSEKPL